MMATQEKDRICGSLVQKLISGTSLSEAERSHFAVSQECMAQAIALLDEKAHVRRTSSTDPKPSPEAVRALNRGNDVFEREFGISLRKK
jgi:hypothetical protein